MSRWNTGGLKGAAVGVALALAALGAAAPAGPAAAIGRVCPAGAPNCDPEALPGCPPGHPNCDPETVGRGRWSGDGDDTKVSGGWADPGAHARRGCPPGQPSCGPETVGLARNGWPDGTPGNTSLHCPVGHGSCHREN
jgi:hypothetical protein